MTAQKVTVTRKIPDAGIDLLKAEGYELNFNDEDRALSREELLDAVREADAVLCMLHDRIDQEVIDAAPNAKVFSNYAVGYNNIDLDACRAANRRVTNTPGVLTDATADTAFTLLMAAARCVVESDQYLRAGKWTGWSPMLFLGADITGATLGIVGAGRIGKATAERGAHGFGMKILYTRGKGKDPLPDWEESMDARMVDLDTLLAESDFVSIHCPYMDSTRHLIGKESFKKMKKSAVLINTARGPIEDEVALIEALKSGEIAAAGLDVYEEEPKIAPGLTDLPNTVLLPHLGSATVHTRDAMATLAAKNLIAILKGEEPPHAVV
ncbi:MAG: D-glycerate dehydrogenase [Candidatus Omnitrophica bacterium]|nr:D-glycerate dehydrogenase [Candidatus Omnitrophota bacterium]